MMQIPYREPPTLQEPKKWSKEFRGLIAICLNKQQQLRPSTAEVLSNQFFMKKKRDGSSLRKLAKKFQEFKEVFPFYI